MIYRKASRPDILHCKDLRPGHGVRVFVQPSPLNCMHAEALGGESSVRQLPRVHRAHQVGAVHKARDPAVGPATKRVRGKDVKAMGAVFSSPPGAPRVLY